jgi:DNA processing protein
VDNELVLLHLSLIDGVGPATVTTLVQKCENLSVLYDCSERDLVALKWLSPASAKKVVDGLKNRAPLEKELALIERHAICWTTVQSPDYPELLKSIYIPPVVLYWQGKIQLPDHVVAVVGSRKASRYGHMAIERMVPDLVEHGVAIVSGGALGADSMAHTCTLDAGGQTLAIVGSGLLEPYPTTNKKLFDRIIAEGGAVVSPFSLATKPHPGNFPARNRIIAGMSHACLVVQAAARSGALITAQYALEQGKDILAVPGMINDPLSEGCHALIRDGAFLVTCAQDILGVFGEFKELAAVGSVLPSDDKAQQLALGEKPTSLATRLAKNVSAKFSSKISTTFLSKVSAGQAVESDTEVADGPENLSIRIIRTCVQARALDELAGELEVTLEEVMHELFELQLAGKVQQNFAGLWQTA